MNTYIGIHGRLEMKKTVFLLSFVVVSAGVWGMTNVRVDRGDAVSSVNFVSIEKNNREPKPVLQNLHQNVNQVSLHSRQRSSEPKDQNQKKKQKISKKSQALDFLAPKELNPQTEEKIEKFVDKLRKKKGKTDPDLVKKVLIEYSTQPNVSMREIAENNNIPLSALFNWRAKAGLPFRCKIPNICTSQVEIDPDTREKIRNFSRNGKHRIYSAKQIEEALIDWVTKGCNESNEISYRSLFCWSQELGIASIHKDIIKKSKEAKRNYVKNLNQRSRSKDNDDQKKFVRQTLKDSLDKEPIEISQREKEDLLNTYRKGLFTKKGLAEKYGIKESNLNFILDEARKSEKDLSRIKVRLSKYLRANQVSETTKESLVNDYDQGLLSLEGISIKYNIYIREVKKIIVRRNTIKIKQGMKNKQIDYNEIIFDLRNKSLQDISNKYGYKFTHIADLKRYVTLWEQLTDDQKKLFKTTINTKTMPTKEVLSSIKSSSNDGINEKFEKFLFVMTSTREEIGKKYSLSKKGIGRLRRGVNLWKVLAKEM